jgi:hypothetical protein
VDFTKRSAHHDHSRFRQIAQMHSVRRARRRPLVTPKACFRSHAPRAPRTRVRRQGSTLTIGVRGRCSPALARAAHDAPDGSRRVRRRVPAIVSGPQRRTAEQNVLKA